MLAAHNPCLGFLICKNRERAGGRGVSSWCHRLRDLRASSQTPSRAVCFPSRLELPSLSSGPQGALGVCALHRGRCASSPGSPVTREPATDQNKRGGAAGRARGASAGSLSRSAGNACQPSRVAPAWAWRWVSDSRWCPLHPRARGRGSPNPHSGSRGASAPVRRSRVAQR